MEHVTARGTMGGERVSVERVSGGSLAGISSKRRMPGRRSQSNLWAECCIHLALFTAAVAMSWSGEGVECEAMVQPSDGHVFERWERAVVTVALGSSCLQDEGSATRISVELSGSNLARGSLSFSWSVEPHLLKDQGLDLELPSSLPDDEYRGNLVIQRLSMPVHFWSISMAEPKISVVFPVDGFAFGRESRPWVQILVSDTTLQEELGVREVRYNVKVAANGTFLADVSSANGNKIYLALPFGVHKVHFSVYDVMWRSTGVMASVLVNVTALLSDVAPPIPDRGLGNVARCPPSESCRTDAECSGRGRCSAGACLCKGDYAGEQCEVSLLESPSFLPALDPRTAPSRCRKARHQASFASEILAKHAPLQHPVECDASTVFLQSRSTRGLGLTLRWLGLAMSEAIVRRKALVIDGMWSWFDFEGCSEGMGCYLTPVSNCTPDDVWRPPPTGGDLSHLADQGKEYVASAKSGELDGRARVGDVMEGHMRKLLEIPRAALGGGLLWWTSSTIAQVVRPTERLRALVKSAMNDVGWRQPAIGMHVRRGDSCADWSRPAPCVPLANYLRACRDMAAKYGARSVFIATDSADVVGEARTALQGLDVMSLAGQERKMFHSDLFIEFRMQMSLMDRRAVTESSLIDLILLSYTDYFIGTFSSAFSAVAFELSVESKGYIPPFASLDIPWRPFLPYEPHPTVSMQNR